MHVENLTVFANAELDFSRGLNVVLGENGTGKSHLLKMAYSILATSWEEGQKNASSPTKALLQTRLAETLGRLAKRRRGRERCDVRLNFYDAALDIALSFSTQSKSEVSVDILPSKWVSSPPTFLPTRELLTIYPGFVPFYESHYLEFEETWRDTALLLGRPLQRGPKEKRIQELLRPLEEAMGGSIELDRNGRFYLNSAAGRMEIPLVAEGLRKFAMLARLIATGALLDSGYLFWDEPESNLNPKLIKSIARSILDLSNNGIQVFIATHSLFLLREIEILVSGPTYSAVSVKYFGLHETKTGAVVQVDQGSSPSDIGNIPSLDEELAQSDRFLSTN
jgi:energy-coupling factor transporter ATP-binding protein EcfA2